MHELSSHELLIGDKSDNESDDKPSDDINEYINDNINIEALKNNSEQYSEPVQNSENLPNNNSKCQDQKLSRQKKHSAYLKRLEKEALIGGDRRSGKLRKPSAKAADMPNIIQ